MSVPPVLDVVIPCFNAESTLDRAVESALGQPGVRSVWLVDDASTDGTADRMADWARCEPARVRLWKQPCNRGVAAARNVGAWQSDADCLAFLDADDAYEAHALDAALMALHLHAHIGMVRLRLTPVDFPEVYVQHAQFAHAWQVLSMTVGGNIVCRRSLLLAAGGFPENALFRRLGGEDAALGIAFTRSSVVGTLWEGPGVRHYFHAGIHAERLLRQHLWGDSDDRIQPADREQAEQVTLDICARLSSLQAVLDAPRKGICPLTVEYAPSGRQGLQP